MSAASRRAASTAAAGFAAGAVSAGIGGADDRPQPPNARPSAATAMIRPCMRAGPQTNMQTDLVSSSAARAAEGLGCAAIVFALTLTLAFKGGSPRADGGC